MLAGLIFTHGYIVCFKFLNLDVTSSLDWLWGSSPVGIGTFGMLINIVVSVMVSKFTSKIPYEIEELIDNIRQP